jgi:hypothetical protein
MDEDLKCVAEAAAEFVAGGGNPLIDFLEAIDPQTVLSLLSRLSAAAERERELVEALREADEALCDYACATDDTPCIRSGSQCGDMCGEPAVFARQRIARALQAKEAGE